MWLVVFDVMHGWGFLWSARGNPSQTLISRGVGIGAKTISVLFFCISRNCRMNSVVWSRFLSKIKLTTFASTACLRVGNFDKACSMAFWTISRRVVSTFPTSFSDRGSNWSTGLRNRTGLPLALNPLYEKKRADSHGFRKVTNWITTLKNSHDWSKIPDYTEAFPLWHLFPGETIWLARVFNCISFKPVTFIQGTLAKRKKIWLILGITRVTKLPRLVSALNLIG